MVIKVFLDSADLTEMREVSKRPNLRGFTTNPSIMKKAGVRDYEAFAITAVTVFPHLPISLEVFADEFDEMERQAHKIAGWGQNVYVKIPITNTKGESACDLIRKLSGSGVKVNVTAVLSYVQVNEVLDAVNSGAQSIISVFAGRIADTGRMPNATITHALQARRSKRTEVLWASPRQVLDVYTAGSLGCDIITVTKDIFDKLALEGKNLAEFSLETVAMFYRDAKAAGYSI